MQFKRTLEIKVNHKHMIINVADILYIKASVNDCYIHVTSGSVYKTRSKYKIDADDRIHELPYGCEPKAV